MKDPSLDTQSRGIFPRFTVLGVVLCVGLWTMCAGNVWGASRVSPEYKLKAAFLNRFAMFVDWPEGKNPEGDDAYIIGVIGADPFKNYLEEITSNPVGGRPVIIQRFEGMPAEADSKTRPKMDQVRKCHLLFVSASEEKSVGRLLEQLKGHMVLTVGDMPDFVDKGGMIQFINEDQKVRFAINLKAVKEENLEIRSKLLRLAKDVEK